MASRPSCSRQLGPSTGAEFAQSNMLANVASTQQAVGRDRHGYIGCDATTVSSREITFYAFEGRPSKLSCWLMPIT